MIDLYVNFKKSSEEIQTQFFNFLKIKHFKISKIFKADIGEYLLNIF